MVRAVALAVCFLVWLCAGILVAGESSGKSELDAYFKLLGYEKVQLKGNEQNKLQIEGRLGEKKALFMVDSGWGLTTLDERAARGLKRLGDLGGTLEDGHFGTISDPTLAIIDKLVIGRAQFLNQPARVKKLEMEYVDTPYEGILGCDFFLRNYCLIDCARRCLYVRGAKLSEQQSNDMAETFKRSGFVEVPTDSMRALVAKVEINGHPADLLVDTGAWTSVLDEEQSKPLELIPYKESANGTHMLQEVTTKVVGVGKIGTHHMRVMTIKNFQLGSRKLQSIHFGVANLDAWGKPDERKWVGVLGEDVLEGQQALLDFSSGKVWLTRPKP